MKKIKNTLLVMAAIMTFSTVDVVEAGHIKQTTPDMNVSGRAYSEYHNDFDAGMHYDLLVFFHGWSMSMGQEYKSHISSPYEDFFHTYDPHNLLIHATYNGESAGYFMDGTGFLRHDNLHTFNVVEIMSSDEHLYLFTIDQDGIPKVLYMSVEAEYLDFSKTQNQELRDGFERIYYGY